MPSLYTFPGPNGNLNVWWFRGTHEDADARLHLILPDLCLADQGVLDREIRIIFAVTVHLWSKLPLEFMAFLRC